MKKFYSKNPFLTLTLSVMVGVLAVISGASAVSTISTNISTGGTLSVTGASTLAAVTTSGTLTVGSDGTALTEIIKGSCTSFTANTLATGDGLTHAASTTKAYDCAVTNVESGDTVFAQFATSTPNSAGALFTQAVWSIVGAQASTTNGYITLMIWNNGPDAIPSALGVGSSTNYLIIR